MKLAVPLVDDVTVQGILVDFILLLLDISSSFLNTPVTATIWYCRDLIPLGNLRMPFITFTAFADVRSAILE